MFAQLDPAITKFNKGTSVQTGLAIVTGNNAIYDERMATLNKLIKPLEENTSFIDDVSNYNKLQNVENALKVLNNIGPNVFSKANGVTFSDDGNPQSGDDINEALTLRAGKIVLDCDNSSYIYIEVLERQFTVEKDPVVFLDCTELHHALIRWKFIDGTHIDWETTAGRQATTVASNRYDAKNDKGIPNCTEIPPNSNEFYAVFFTNSGDAKVTLKNYTDAIKDYDQASKLNPKYARAYSNSAYVNKLLKDYPAYIQDYDELIKLEPNNADNYFQRGSAKHILNDYAGAVADFKDAVRLNPNDTMASDNLKVAEHNLSILAKGVKEEKELFSKNKKYSIKIKLNIVKKIESIDDITLAKGYNNITGDEVKTLNTDGTFVITCTGVDYKITPNFTTLSIEAVKN